MAQELTAIEDHKGNSIGTRVFKPQEVYREVREIPPDLIVYFGDLYWRSVGSLGYDGWHTFENDTGPDSCNHAENGMFILCDPRSRAEDTHIMDIAPTILKLMHVRIPPKMQGRAL